MSNAKNAISSYKTFLMHGTQKLIDIKSFPDLGGDPNTIEVTTLSDSMQVFIEGLKSSDALSFTANYTPEDFATCQALEGKQEEYGVWFGGTGDDDTLTPTGDKGKFTFTGTLSVHVSGAGTGDAVEMSITITPSTEIKYTAGGTTNS